MGRPSLDLMVFFRLHLIAFFAGIAELCLEAGLVDGEEIYFDATKVEANCLPWVDRLFWARR